MISFLLTLVRLGRATARSLRDPEFRALVAAFVLLIIVGTVFYVRVEGFGVLDALYFCVVSLATVGYGDITPKTSIGKIFTMVYLLTGIGVFVSMVAKIATMQIQAGMTRRTDEGPTQIPAE